MHALLDNFALKIASLGLAGVLWFVIAGEKTSEMGMTVPVELQNFPKDLELTGDTANAVEVRVRASPGIIQRLGPENISAQVDLAGADEGEHIVHLTAETIRIPFGVKVVKIRPSTLTLNLERTLQKTVPIRPRLVGRPAPGYEVAEVTSDPPEVVVSGPKSRVTAIESAFTEPVSMEKAETTIVEHVNVGVEDALLRIQASTRVRVTARVREVHESRAFDRVAVAVRGGPGAVRPVEVKVVVTGPASVLRLVAPEDVRAYVDASKLPDGSHAPVSVELASGHAGVTVSAPEPAKVVFARPRKRS